MTTLNRSAHWYGLDRLWIDHDRDVLIVQSPDGLGQMTVYINKTDILDGTARLETVKDGDHPHFFHGNTNDVRCATIVTTAQRIAEIDEWVGYGAAFPYEEVCYRHGRYRIKMPTSKMPDIHFEPIQVGVRIHLIASDATTVTVNKNGTIELRGSDELLRKIREGMLPETTS
ncbi:MAG: hypothetical protein HZC01_00595 [Candidatus Kerfeldbacteria bacterium]|nr:hypothetical protein [Candidatus Kerfeldbacteria bacterium]